jgi:predicted TIM-barrel fold metal-dependent hydrolase
MKHLCWLKSMRISIMITHAVNIDGVDKVLYGCEDVTPQDILEADISENDKVKILGLNAAKLLNLKCE